MLKILANKVLLAAPAMLLCAGFAQATTPPVSPITATPASVSISYQLPSTAGLAVPVAFTVAASTDAFVVDATTVPVWLSLSAMSGTAAVSPGVSINFVASSAAGTLPSGTYTVNVHVRVSGFQDLVVPVTLAVNDPTSTVSVRNGVTPVADNGTVALTWIYGSTPYPTKALTILSSDQPVAFTAAETVTSPAAPATWIQLSGASGIAYNFGTALTVSFLPDVLQNSTVGQHLTGQVTITYGSGPTVIHVNFDITVGEPNAAVTRIFPDHTPLHSSGSLTVSVTGSGFGTVAQGYASKTVVSISYGSVTTPVDLTTVASADSTPVLGAVSVINPTTMLLTIPWEDTNAVSILNTAQDVTITITNGLGGETAATAVLHVTASPIIYSITDGAALTEAAAGTAPPFAPYEVITLFGDNFGPTAGTPVLGALDSFSRYPATLTANSHAVTVSFYKGTGVTDGTTHIADAYLLFATNNQINALVPSGITATGITDLQIVVTYNAIASASFAAKPAATNPGIFTTAASGQGQGAILLSNFTVNSNASASTKAAKGSTVLIYVTGLGTPNSAAADTTSTTAIKFPGSCISPANYVAAEALVTPATADGAVILASKIASGHLPPCFATTATTPTVLIGGSAATVTYAGWVADSVSGLYQINATVPSKAASGAAIPVVVKAGGVSSQAGVTMAIQ
jgi:uncharacterized protein (TIGR03437 family)